MSIHRTSKSGLFLLELMIIILFFSLTSAVCANLFVSAYSTSNANKELNQAMLKVQTAAECVKNAGGEITTLRGLLSVEPQKDGSLKAFYDKEWMPASADNCAYTLTIQQECGADNTLRAQIHMRGGHQQREIFSLEVKRYLGGRAGASA